MLHASRPVEQPQIVLSQCLSRLVFVEPRVTHMFDDDDWEESASNLRRLAQLVIKKGACSINVQQPREQAAYFKARDPKYYQHLMLIILLATWPVALITLPQLRHTRATTQSSTVLITITVF